MIMQRLQLSDKRKRSTVVEITVGGTSPRRWGMSLQGNRKLWSTKVAKLDYVLKLSVGR